MSLKRTRDTALQEIGDLLERDDRFEAAWLGGSFGRGEEDEYSDLDLTAVVSNAHAPELCERQRATGAGTIPARLDIISAIGKPVVVHEHHANAPAGGSFTAVIYASGLAVDWTLIPAEGAVRSTATRLLFDRMGIPVAGAGAPGGPLRTDRLSERYAFFWLLAIPAAKAWRRRDRVKFHALLEMLHGVKREIEHLLRGASPAYTRHSLAPFCADSAEERRALQQVCADVGGLAADVQASGASVPEEPERVLGLWLAL